MTQTAVSRPLEAAQSAHRLALAVAEEARQRYATHYAVCRANKRSEWCAFCNAMDVAAERAAWRAERGGSL